jgi:death-on-curing protein
VYDKAAAYCYFIARAHPFFDGNKRTGLLAALHYLLNADVTPVFDEDEMYDLITGIVTGEVEVEQLADAFRKAGQGRR